MTTTVAYHADGYAPARPAINVKLHVPGRDLRSAEVDAGIPDYSDAIHESAYDRVQSDFWQAAEELAAQYGLGAITQEGRSGGWLVFEDLDNRLPCREHEALDTYCDDELEALDAYSRYAAWVNAELAAAPGHVARLAQDMAMDELGSLTVYGRTLRTMGAGNRVGALA